MTIRKILCIKPRGIGDILLSTIVLDNLARHFPDVKIDYLTEAFARQSVANNPLVNNVLTMGKKEFPLWVALRIRKEKYDMILDLWSNPRSAQITFLSGVKHRVGYAYRGRTYAYNHLATSEKGSGHAAEHNLELLKPIGVPIVTKKVSYRADIEADRFGKKFRQEHFAPDDIVIGVIPAGGWPSKRCDASKWIEICKAIHAKWNARFIILWGPGDEADAQQMQRAMSGFSVLAPETELSALAGMINNCDIIVANDSGPMHISAAIGKPTLGIFGPTNPRNHGPYSRTSDFVSNESLFCIVCNKLECPYHHECMLDLSIELVLQKIEKIGIGIIPQNTH